MDVSESSYVHSYDGRMSALPERVEVRVRPERRRRWSSAAKLAIVRETLAPSATAQAVADRHGIGTGLIYTWRKQMLRAAMAGFTGVEIKPDAQAALPAPVQDAPPVAVASSSAMAVPSKSSCRPVCGCGLGRTWTAPPCSACWRRWPLHDAAAGLAGVPGLRVH